MRPWGKLAPVQESHITEAALMRFLIWSAGVLAVAALVTVILVVVFITNGVLEFPFPSQGLEDEKSAINGLCAAMNGPLGWPTSEAELRRSQFELEGRQRDFSAIFPARGYEVSIDSGPGRDSTVRVHSRATRRTYLIARDGRLRTIHRDGSVSEW